MSTSLRVIKNTGFLYFRLIITLVVSLWTTRIILEALGVDNFGVYNVVGGVVALLGFLNASLSTSSQRFLSYAEGKGDKKQQLIVFNCCIVLHISIGIIVGLLFILAGFIFFNGILNIPSNRIFAAEIVYASTAVSALASILSVPYEATINAHENMRYYAFIGILEVLLKLAIAFLVIFIKSDRLIIYGILMGFIHVITFLIIRTYCHKKYSECKIDFKKYINKPTIKELGSFAGWNLLSSSSSMITQYGMNIIVNHFFGVIVNAAQGIAAQVSGVLSNLSTNALKALNPIIVKSESQHDRNRMLYISLMGCKISFFIFGFLSMPLMLNMALILDLWLTEVPQWTIIFCQYGLVRILLEQLTFGLTTSIMAHGNIRRFNIWRSISNITPLIVTPILFKYNFEPFWMYVVWIVSWSCLGGLVIILFSHKLVGMSIRQYLRENLLPCLLTWCLPYVSSVYILRTVNYMDYRYNLLVTIIGILFYLALSWYFILNREERKILLNILLRKFK
ncbi:hypothetical protein [uncultured Duncaniella sp.]|uniref:hypothetical protein n=1 Tax=uncultured Duncaniella sp. TaxID=2768039 RepID=UPI0025B382AB|nr:hypothetical protein [uncultured Duncaniella sp.]